MANTECYQLIRLPSLCCAGSILVALWRALTGKLCVHYHMFIHLPLPLAPLALIVQSHAFHIVTSKTNHEPIIV